MVQERLPVVRGTLSNLPTLNLRCGELHWFIGVGDRSDVSKEAKVWLMLLEVSILFQNTTISCVIVKHDLPLVVHIGECLMTAWYPE